MCLTKIGMHGTFKLRSIIYFQNNYVNCDMLFLVEKISALFCFLDGFGIAVPVFSYQKHPTRSSIV